MVDLRRAVDALPLARAQQQLVTGHRSVPNVRGLLAPARVGDSQPSAQLGSWLPADLPAEVAAMLASGRRMAQEAVGFKALRNGLGVL